MNRRRAAEQIRETRLARGWTQSDLARATNKVQETISQLENPDYGSYTIKTLERLAEALDVSFTYGFESFSELLRRINGLSSEDLAVPDFDNDPGIHMDGTNGSAHQSAPHNAEDKVLSESTGVMIVPSNMTMRDNVISIEPFLKRASADTRSIVVK